MCSKLSDHLHALLQIATNSILEFTNVHKKQLTTMDSQLTEIMLAAERHTVKH
jgi:hypothetical protein